MVTSKNCSRLRRIFRVARQAMVIVCRTVSASATWWDRVAGVDGRVECVMAVVIGVSSGGLGVVVVASWVSWPVSARNTSSREGLATATDSMAMPASRMASSTSTARSLRGSGDGEAAGLGAGDGLSSSSRSTTATARSQVGAVGELDLQRRAADRRLELVGRAERDGPAAVDDLDPVGELVGLVEVLRGQQHGAALADQLADGLPHLAAGARVEAGGRLVQEDQRRPGDQAGGQVEPAAHAAGEVLDRLARRLR